MRTFILLAMISSGGLWGCATAQPIVGPDGSKQILISAPAIEQAYHKAREACGGDYEIVDKTTESYAGSTTIKLIIKCKR